MKNRPYQLWYDTLNDSRFSPSSKAIKDYLRLTTGLESPTPYHVWSFISLIAALCGDRIALANGPMGKLRLNLGVVLTGVPAIRKSSALTIMQRFAEGLPISYGPTDTSGQRQGIMSAMLPRWQKDLPDDSQAELSIASLEELADLDSSHISAALPDLTARHNPSHLYFVAKELGRLIASTTRELLDFFTDAMDGETIDYKLKNQQTKIRNPLINIIGATTPSNLGQMMPRGAAEHGFLSRLIFVHAGMVANVVPIVAPWSTEQKQVVKDMHESIMAMLDTDHEEMSLSQAATDTYIDLYDYQPALSDLRLQAYGARRSGHLLKLAAILALLRDNSTSTVIASDVRLAHALLVLTETEMDRAFYGLEQGVYSRILCAFAELSESSASGVVQQKMILSAAGHLGDKDMLAKMLSSLQDQGKILPVDSASSISWRLDSLAKETGESKLNLSFRQVVNPLPDQFVPVSRSK